MEELALANQEPHMMTWYICFSDRDVKPRWFHVLMKKGFKHCFAFTQINDHVYYVDPNTAYVRPNILEGIRADILAHSLKAIPNSKVLTFTFPLDLGNKLFRVQNCAPTCVSVIKMFLGITSWAHTPYQLYKALVKRGASLDSRINLGGLFDGR